jgi:hypothetical protein
VSQGTTLTPAWRDLLLVFGVVAALSLVSAVILVALLWRRLRRLRTSGGGFWQTLREVPFGLVVVLDLLDLALDVFSAPIIWLLLKRLGLTALREVATIEALIPISAPIPTMTACWLAARLKVDGRPLFGADPAAASRDPGTLEAEQVAPGQWRARPPDGEGPPR